MNFAFDLGLSRGQRDVSPWWHSYRAGPGGALPAVVLENETGRLHGASRINAHRLDVSALDLSQGFTLYARGRLDYTLGGTGYPRLVEVGSSGSNADRHLIYIHEASGKVQAAARDTNVPQFFAELSGSAQPSGGEFRAAVRFLPNDYAGCWNGGALKTDTLGTVPGTLTRINLRSTFGQGPVPGFVDRLVLWTGALSNAELQAYAA